MKTFDDIRCLCLYSYIKPQLVSKCYLILISCLCLYSYIKPQLGDFHSGSASVVYVSIPTSNHNYFLSLPPALLLFMSLFLHQTTTWIARCSWSRGCLCLYSYIKPQQCANVKSCDCVVYVSIPTSNHNCPVIVCCCWLVVYVSIPTSNHNRYNCLFRIVALFMSLFLHQTTTVTVMLKCARRLFMSLFLHQTTTMPL